MKIVTKCIISLETLEVVEEESFEYFGPIAKCKGGGGTSGKVDYPDYMKAAHEDWLTESGTDSIEKSVTEVMNDAMGASPWAAQLAYDPSADLTASTAAIAAFAAVLAGLSDTANWVTLATQASTTIGAKYVAVVADKVGTALTPAQITASIAAFSNDLSDDVNTKVLPRFRRGMQDINAVVSSAFPIGEAIIESYRLRDVARYDSEIRLKAIELNTDIDKGNLLKDIHVADMNLRSDLEYERMYLEGSNQMMKLMIQRISWLESNTRTTIEANRIKIVAMKEENDVNMEIDKDDALWDLEVFKYGSNVLAGISGGTSGDAKGSKVSSAIGGALAGAAAGAYVGSVVPGIGTVAGAGIGAGIGLLGGLF